MNRKVLYIDDESDLLDLASSFFEEENIEIDCASRFMSAIDLIRKNKYEIIISDVQLPDGNGHELFNLIRKDNLYCRYFIMVSGNINFGEEFKNGYDLVIYKPVDFQDLVAKVKAMLSDDF